MLRLKLSNITPLNTNTPVNGDSTQARLSVYRLANVATFGTENGVAPTVHSEDAVTGRACWEAVFGLALNI